ncbi:MAG: tail fiber domain-containing protein [Pirellulaceae bacterium]
MDQDPQVVVSAGDMQTAEPPRLDATSLPFVGRWNQLVSNTNWEKGRIIYQWREALQESGASANEYSDEAWHRLVGGVTGQHVGRLRRVFQRFGTTRSDYEGLHWSHFQATLDWDDSEMWLEGAVQNRWSVSQMRHQRWETLGKLDEERPRDEEVVTSELDEDFEPANDEAAERELPASRPGPRDEGPDFGDESSDADRANSQRGASESAEQEQEPDRSIEFVRPFAGLTELPNDLAEVLEACKLVILHHKMEDWQQVAREDVLASLEALKQLVLAPSSESSPF